MDPDAAWAIVGSGASTHERAVAALHLLEWLAGGGFLPMAGPNPVTRTRAVRECHLVIGNALDRLDELTEDS